MSKKRNTVLVADSDPLTRKMMKIILDNENYCVVDCPTGKQTICLSASVKPNLILLEKSLPDMNGVEVIQAIREWSNIPIIIISDCTDDQEIVTALNSGANDYVFKPFNATVLLARINAALRLNAIKDNGNSDLHNGALRLDLIRHEVFLNDTLLSFTPKEYNLLRYFMIHKGKMLRHHDILKEVWGSAHCSDVQYLRVFIARIRDKIEFDPAQPHYIVTVAGIGYRMDAIPTNHDRDHEFEAKKPA